MVDFVRVGRSGGSREAEGGVPPRVLRDCCRKTLTPQPLAESPPPLPAQPALIPAGAIKPRKSTQRIKPAGLDYGVCNLNFALLGRETPLGFRVVARMTDLNTEFGSSPTLGFINLQLMAVLVSDGYP